MPHHSRGTEHMSEHNSQTLQSHCLSAYGWHSNLSPLFPKFHLFSHCDWTSGDGSSQDILQPQSCTQSQLCESHNLWSSVSAPGARGGRCHVNKGVGSNNHMELLMLPWIPPEGKQTISRGWEAVGKLEHVMQSSQKSICPYLQTNLHPCNLSLRWKWYSGRVYHTPQTFMSFILIYDYSEVYITCNICEFLKGA